MTTEFMRDLLSKDEKITVEYKTCQFGIQEDVYETVCSFSNRKRTISSTLTNICRSHG